MSVKELRDIVQNEYSSDLVLPNDEVLKNCINLLAELASIQYKLSKEKQTRYGE